MTGSPRSPITGKVVRVVFSVGGVAALLWLLQRIGWSQVAAVLGRVGVMGGAILVALGILEGFLDSAALRVCVRGPIGPLRLLGYHNAGALLNMAVPFELGEVLKGTLIQRHVSAHEAASGTIIWNYVFKVSRPAAALTVALMGLVLGARLPGSLETLLVVAVMAGFVPWIVLRFAVRAGTAVALVRIGRKLHLLRKDPEVWLAAATKLDHTLRSFWGERRRDFVRVFFLQVFARFTSFMCTFLTVRAFGMPLSFASAALVHAGLSSAEYILMLLPARIGVSEGAAYMVFQLFGLDPAMGVLVALALRLRSIAANALGSLLMLIK